MRFFNKIFIIIISLFYPIGNSMVMGQDAIALSELHPDATFICTNADERWGYSMSGAGDVNGDGFDDFMVAAYHNYVHGWNSGGVYLFTGGLNQTWGFNVDIEDAATAIFRGSNDYDMVGYNVAGKGDFNGDGFDDLIIGAPGTWDTFPETPGWVYIVFGKKEMDWGKDSQVALSADVKIRGEADLDQLGYANSFVGDINHDGFDDIICSAAYRNQYKKWDGKAYLILGDSTGWKDTDLVSQSAAASFVYPMDEALVGYSVAGVGDVNQDGTPDFVIGVPGANMACLILGRPAVDWGHYFDLNNADYKFIGEFEGDYAGSWISHVNDVNNDGYSDFLISAIKSFFDGGRIYLVKGRSSWSNREISLGTVEASFRGEDVETHTGFCTSGLKDYDGDGYDDFLIGARYLNGPFPHSGKMYLIKGRETGWQHDLNLENITGYFWGDDSITCAGWQVTDVGDVNGDNAHDFATTGPFNSTGAHWGGKLFLFYGNNVSYQVNGSVKYYSHQQPIANTKLELKAFSFDSTFSDNGGKYAFTLTRGHNYMVTPKKDFEKKAGDFTVSAYDAALVARHVIYLDTLAYYHGIAADVDQDKKVCMYDAAQIARYAIDLAALDSSHVGEFLFDPPGRNYEEVRVSYQDEDYTGLVMGDVDGNWHGANTPVSKSVPVGSILPGSITALIGSRISIPLRVHKQADVISADIQILYDPQQLEFIDVKKSEFTNGFTLFYNNQPAGQLKIAIYTAKPVNIDGVIIRLEFKAINRKKTGFTELDLSSFQVNSYTPVSDRSVIYIVDKRSYQIPVELSNQPNPFNPTTTIIYQNSIAGHGQLVIYDIMGKVVRSFDLGRLPAGVHELLWDGRDESGIELASGVFYVKFICEKEVKINKMIKLK